MGIGGVGTSKGWDWAMNGTRKLAIFAASLHPVGGGIGFDPRKTKKNDRFGILSYTKTEQNAPPRGVGGPVAAHTIFRFPLQNFRKKSLIPSRGDLKESLGNFAFRDLELDLTAGGCLRRVCVVGPLIGWLAPWSGGVGGRIQYRWGVV